MKYPGAPQSKRLEEQMKQVMDTFNRYQAPAVRAANEAANRGIEQWQKFAPQIRQMIEQAERTADYPRLAVIRSFTFARGGWHDVPLSGMVAGTFRKWADELADKPDEEVKAELDEVIPAYFANDGCSALRDMVEGWDLYPDWRRRVFREAFWAHKNRKYILAVSALAPQIEGMLRQETGEYEENARYIQRINETLDFRYSRNKPPAPPSLEDLDRAIQRLRTQGIPERYRTADRISLEHALLRVNGLYNRGRFSDPDFVNSTNRHAIVHGVAEDFGELESVKLCCAIELVHEIVVAYRAAIEPGGEKAD